MVLAAKIQSNIIKFFRQTTHYAFNLFVFIFRGIMDYCLEMFESYPNLTNGELKETYKDKLNSDLNKTLKENQDQISHLTAFKSIKIERQISIKDFHSTKLKSKGKLSQKKIEEFDYRIARMEAELAHKQRLIELEQRQIFQNKRDDSKSWFGKVSFNHNPI